MRRRLKGYKKSSAANYKSDVKRLERETEEGVSTAWTRKEGSCATARGLERLLIPIGAYNEIDACRRSK
jgi:hypothetical protein